MSTSQNTNSNSNSSVIAEGDMVVELSASGSSYTAGGESGAAVLEDVTLTLEQDNTMHHGIGNDEPVDHTSGNRTYSLDEEAQVSKAVYEAMKSMYKNGDPASGAIIGKTEDGTEVVNANVGKIVWNQIELGASDGEDVTVSFQADCYEVDLK